MPGGRYRWMKLAALSEALPRISIFMLAEAIASRPPEVFPLTKLLPPLFSLATKLVATVPKKVAPAMWRCMPTPKSKVG